MSNVWDWTVPPAWQQVGRRALWRPFSLLVHRGKLKLCRGNSRYRGCHQGQRAFIVCNGPSVQRQDLLPLKDEIVFSVSSGYLHKDYAAYHPNYHCVPHITYSQKWTPEVTVAWFREMQEKLGAAHLFLNYREEPLVRQNNPFPGRVVNFIWTRGVFGKNPSGLPDLTRNVPGENSVPIMCLMIALYMGFKEIYLLGADHDSFKTGEYKYFFRHTVLANKLGDVDEDDKIAHPLCEELDMYHHLFAQYRALKSIAMSVGARLYNATAGGALDELERVSLEDVLASPRPGR